DRRRRARSPRVAGLARQEPGRRDERTATTPRADLHHRRPLGRTCRLAAINLAVRASSAAGRDAGRQYPSAPGGPVDVHLGPGDPARVRRWTAAVSGGWIP